MEMPVLRPPLPSQSQWSISEDALHQLRWPRGRRGWVGVGAGPEPLSAPPQSGSLAELDPFCFLLPPHPPRPTLMPCFLLRLVDVRRESMESGTFCGLSVNSKTCQWAQQFASERRK
ncbi:unnamed protein product [Rangifer tarandus platyrhynchus]|uniref:Uncharacterized protein n=1 Tax=Rangifer tarandus platyrhynchus TaxID=3082113 RepID=A0AC59YXB6_RANTA